MKPYKLMLNTVFLSTLNISCRRGRKGGRNDNCPTVPNQPSEASAHFFFELAKTVLNRAGGSSSTALFTQECTNSNHSGPHRGLHLCAFEIGLYALRLHNAVTPNWLSRTYSSHVSWITGWCNPEFSLLFKFRCFLLFILLRSFSTLQTFCSVLNVSSNMPRLLYK